jgi:hypothetical protein
MVESSRHVCRHMIAMLCRDLGGERQIEASFRESQAVSKAYAFECRCSHRRERFQLAFARAAIELLPQQEETAYEPTRAGLTMLAETELSLERPLVRLREVYGDELQVTPLAVRYRRVEHVEEPYMGLRVLCAPKHFDAVHRDLLMRKAAIEDAEINEQYAVVRATAPAALLISYPGRVRQLTAGRSQLAMWFSHYAPVEDGPPGGNAA